MQILIERMTKQLNELVRAQEIVSELLKDKPDSAYLREMAPILEDCINDTKKDMENRKNNIYSEEELAYARRRSSGIIGREYASFEEQCANARARSRQKYVTDMVSDLLTAIERGVLEGERKIAKALLDNGIDVNTVAEITDLTVDDVLRL